MLVNNAGLELVTLVESADPAAEDACRRIVDINVMGTFYVTRRARPKMGRAARHRGQRRLPGLGQDGRQHAVAEGAGGELRPVRGYSLLAEIMAAQTFDGLIEPADMADIYLFLASDAARNITGQAVTVDRGELLA